MNFENRVVLVTGAASGMGRAAALLFAEAGATVLGADIDGAGLGTLSADLTAVGYKNRVGVVDISDERNVNDFVASSVAAYGKIDVLFNNAAIGPSASSRHTMSNVIETPPQAWDTIVAINLKGTALMCRAMLPHMLEAGSGSIVNNASINGIIGMPGADAYTATKGGIVALTRAMAVEWGGRGVRVNCICPGPVDTPMNAPWLADPARREFLETSSPMGRVAQPEEVANVALFLASDLASFINGAIVPVDGGWTAA